MTNLLDEAMHAARNTLSQLELPTIVTEITRPNQNGFASEDIHAPDYIRIIWREIEKLAQLPESLSLTHYLWDSGALRKSMHRTDGSPVSRGAWELATWNELIHGPLRHLLHVTALEDLTAGTHEPWRLDPTRRRTACSDIAQQYVRGRRTVRAECMVDMAFDSTQLIELEPGVTLKQLTLLEQCIHLTKYHREYSTDDIQSLFNRVRIEVTKTVDGLENDAGTSAIAEAIDRAKWSICVAGHGAIFKQGPIIIRGPGGSRGSTLRRQEYRLGATISYMTAKVADEDLVQASEALRALQQVTQGAVSKRLHNAIWLFGRACTATLARDSLLDAVVGLDSLLGAGSESRYRVSLHGATLLADSNSNIEEAFSNLHDMYGLRSGAAHSAGSEESQFTDLDTLSRQYLARVIDKIVRLINSKAVVVKSGEQIPRALERWIRGLLARGLPQPSNPTNLPS